MDVGVAANKCRPTGVNRGEMVEWQGMVKEVDEVDQKLEEDLLSIAEK
jgi:hypothetical protein